MVALHYFVSCYTYLIFWVEILTQIHRYVHNGHYFRRFERFLLVFLITVVDSLTWLMNDWNTFFSSEVVVLPSEVDSVLMTILPVKFAR